MKKNEDGSVEFHDFWEFIDFLKTLAPPEEEQTWEDEGGAIMDDDRCPECGRKSGHKMDCSQ